MNKTVQRVYIRARYRCRLLLRCTAVLMLVVTGGVVAPFSYAEQCPTKAAGASSHAPAYSQLERLDEKALSAIRGKGGAGTRQSLIDLSIILWDEPGSGGSKPHALAENNPSVSGHGLISGHYESYANVSVSRR